LQLFAHLEISERFSIVSSIIFEVNIVAGQLFVFYEFALPSTLLLPPAAVLSSLTLFTTNQFLIFNLLVKNPAIKQVFIKVE